jgi:putative flippase GtrA
MILMERARVMRYAVAGAVATGLHVVIASGLITFAAAPPALANGIAFSWASIFSYLATTAWTFGVEPSPRSGVRFAVTAALSSGLAALVSGIAAARGVHHLLGIFAVICTAPPFTYFLHKHFTYRI